MRFIILFMASLLLLSAADNRSPEEIENENLKLRLLLKKLEVHEQKKRTQSRQKKIL